VATTAINRAATIRPGKRTDSKTRFSSGGSRDDLGRRGAGQGGLIERVGDHFPDRVGDRPGFEDALDVEVEFAGGYEWIVRRCCLAAGTDERRARD
jgi:hypothetical protein